MSLSTTPLSSQQHTDGTDILQAWRETVFASVIRIVAIAGSVAYFAGMAIAFRDLDQTFFLLYTTAYLLILGSAYLTRIPTIYRAGVFTAMLFALGLLSSVEKAAIGDGRVWLISSAIFAAVFLGRRAGLVFTSLAALAWALIGYLFTASIIPQPEVSQYAFSIWSGTTLTLLIATLSIVLSIGALLVNLNKTTQESYSLAKQSDEQSEKLQKQSQILERRSETLQASSNVNRALALTLDPEELLRQAAGLLQEEFALNCTGVFLLNHRKDGISLKASSKENVYGGPASDYHLSLTEDMIGHAITSKKALAYHEGDEKNAPLLEAQLPETRSQTAIPLWGRREIIGALALQSEELRAFGPERLTILQILADQISMSLENARLFTEREAALEAERQAYGEVTESAWSKFALTTGQSGVHRDQNGLSPVEMGASPRQGKGADDLVQSIPIKIRGKTIGYVDAHNLSQFKFAFCPGFSIF